MAFNKITTHKIYEQIADQLKAQIVNGGWKRGEKLPSTKELSEQFQVGRSTMREALSALKAMGLIEIRQGEGCFVREVTGDEVQLPQFEALLLGKDAIFDLMAARKALEIANASLAAKQRTAEDLAAFEALITFMEAHIGDEAEGEQADIGFHQLLSAATHNPIMVRLLEMIASQMEIAIRETRRLQMYSNKQISHRFWEEHKLIYEAVKAQRPEEAEQRMREHLNHVEKLLLEFLER
ncbi:FadR family transcriptional regulator [Paenibacillaceae bacterium]|nr:FadR family transcriptional regulator [Paenibacillaceae bacterium]